MLKHICRWLGLNKTNIPRCSAAFHLCLCILPQQIGGQIRINPGPRVDCGTSIRLSNWNDGVYDERQVDVWLPPRYPEKAPYSVMYMMDGQMLFDENSTWNSQSWQVDSTLCALIHEDNLNLPVVVGIWNDSRVRHAEYMPEKPFGALNPTEKEAINDVLQKLGRTETEYNPSSNRFLRFLMKEVRPQIEHQFEVSKGVSSNILVGSSMGGLISWYGMCEYPEYWGGVACLSTHWPGIFQIKDNPLPDAFYAYLSLKIGTLKEKRWYLDSGTQTLDSLYQSLNPRFINLLKEEISEENLSWQLYEGADHSERSWSQRVANVVRFHFTKR